MINLVKIGNFENTHWHYEENAQGKKYLDMKEKERNRRDGSESAEIEGGGGAHGMGTRQMACDTKFEWEARLRADSGGPDYSVNFSA